MSLIETIDVLLERDDYFDDPSFVWATLLDNAFDTPMRSIRQSVKHHPFAHRHAFAMMVRSDEHWERFNYEEDLILGALLHLAKKHRPLKKSVKAIKKDLRLGSKRASKSDVEERTGMSPREWEREYEKYIDKWMDREDDGVLRELSISPDNIDSIGDLEPDQARKARKWITDYQKKQGWR